MHTSDGLNERKQAARRVLMDFVDVRPEARIWIFTDPGRRWFAEHLVDAALELGYRASLTCLHGDSFSAGDPSTEDLSTGALSTGDLSTGNLSTGKLSTRDLSTGELDAIRQMVRSLPPEDIVVSAFSDYSMGRIPFFTVFPNFRPPEGFSGKSAVIRAHYPDEALLQHLLTPLESVDAVANRYLALGGGGRVRVIAEGGTDIKCEIGRPVVLPYKVGAGSRHAFLPPAEVAFGITAGTAEGLLVVDITAGDIVIDGKAVERLGLVDKPVHVELRGGRVSSISGGRTAELLRHWLERLGPENRLAVELGFGLSTGTPIGHGSADECLQGTFHVGFGDDSFFNKVNKAPVHLDLICRGPQITRLP
jgi:hypothetical protein